MPNVSRLVSGGAAVVLAGAACIAAAQQASKPAPHAGKPVPKRAQPPVAGPEPLLPSAPAEQITAAGMAHIGPYACEFDQTVHVDADGKHDGYVNVRHGKMRWTMRPVLSSTGALRLEDVKGRMLMLQIADKSMLMDTSVGRRVVDNCVHEKQRHAPPRPPGESLGIDPVRAAAAAAAAAEAASAAAAAAVAASAASAASAAAAAASAAAAAASAAAN